MRLRHFIVSMRKYTEAAAILSVKNVRWVAVGDGIFLLLECFDKITRQK